MTYGFDAEVLMVWIDSYERVSTDRAGVLCRRHADAMVVPLGWMLDDRRDPAPRLFKAPAQPVTSAPRQRRNSSHQRRDAEQLQLGADVAVINGDDVGAGDADRDDTVDVVEIADDDADRGSAAAVAQPPDGDVLPWKPTFDQTDDLDGLLEARSPLLARAFGGQERPRPSS
jgi:hypothetical protein